MSVEKELNKFGAYVIKQSRANLTRKGKKNTSKLYNSLKYDVKSHRNSFSLSITMEDYGEFVDKGVQGKTSSSKAPKSPFKFGSGTGKKGGLTKGINNWVKSKRFQFRDKKTGRFYSYAQTSFVIIRSIWQTGLETTNFFSKPFEVAFKNLPDELVEAYALEVEDLMKFALK